MDRIRSDENFSKTTRSPRSSHRMHGVNGFELPVLLLFQRLPGRTLLLSKYIYGASIWILNKIVIFVVELALKTYATDGNE